MSHTYNPTPFMGMKWPRLFIEAKSSIKTLLAKLNSFFRTLATSVASLFNAPQGQLSLQAV